MKINLPNGRSDGYTFELNKKDYTIKVFDEQNNVMALSHNWVLDDFGYYLGGYFYTVSDLTARVCRQYLKESVSSVNPESFNRTANTNKFIIGSRKNVKQGWSISDNPAIHNSILSAQTEAERLAKCAPGKEFVLLEVKGVVRASAVIWSQN